MKRKTLSLSVLPRESYFVYSTIEYKSIKCEDNVSDNCLQTTCCGKSV